MKVLLLVLCATLAAAKPRPDVSHLPEIQAQNFGLQGNAFRNIETQTSAPFLGSFYSTTPAPFFQLPLHNAVSFGQKSALDFQPEVSNSGSFGLNYQGIQSTTAAPITNVETSTLGQVGLDAFAPTAAPAFGGVDASFLNNGIRANFPTQAPAFFSTTVAPEFAGADAGFLNTGIRANIPAELPAFFSTTAAPFIETYGNGFGLGNAAFVNPGFGIRNTYAENVDTVAVNADATPTVTKSVYFFDAPEEIQEQTARQVVLPQKKTHYKVIFVKAPTYAAPAPIDVSQVQSQEKTIVYVLHKKPEQPEIRVAQPIPSQTEKPEVFFIKYKTREEAEKAVADVKSGANIGVRANEAEKNLLESIHVVSQGPAFNRDAGLNIVSTVSPYVSQGFNLAPAFAAQPFLRNDGFQSTTISPLTGFEQGSAFGSPFIQSSTFTPLNFDGRFANTFNQAPIDLGLVRSTTLSPLVNNNVIGGEFISTVAGANNPSAIEGEVSSTLAPQENEVSVTPTTETNEHESENKEGSSVSNSIVQPHEEYGVPEKFLINVQ